MSRLYEENNDKIFDRNTNMIFEINTEKILYEPRQCLEKYDKKCEIETKVQIDNLITKKDFLNIEKENELFNLNISNKNNPTFTLNGTTSTPTTTIINQQFTTTVSPNNSFNLYQNTKRISRIKQEYGY